MDAPLIISQTVRADELSKSQFIIIADRPCRITDLTFSGSSHVHPIIHILGIDIATPLKPSSFAHDPEQTYSLHSTPKAGIPVPEIKSIRADRLQAGDYVEHGDLRGHVKLVKIAKAGLRYQVHVVAIEPLRRKTMTAILWDDEMVETPKLEITECRLRAFIELQVVEIDNEPLTKARVECKRLAREIKQFFDGGKKDVWVRMALGEVIGAVEVRVLEAKWPEKKDGEEAQDESLTLLTEGEAPEMVVKKPRGIKAEKIAGFVRDGKTFMVRIKASMWHEEKDEDWTVDELIATEDVGSDPLWSPR